MAGKGAPKGTRYGGRTKGTPNKATLARAAEIAEAKKHEGKPLAIQIIEDGMHRYIALSAPYQKGGPQEDIPKFEHYFDKALDLANKLANYQSPKLQSTTMKGDPDSPVTQTHTINVKFV